MKKLIAILFLFSFCALAQTAYPSYIVGAGASFYNPGTSPTIDVDVHVTGIYFAHFAIGNITVQGGQLFAVARPGAEARIFTASSGLAGLTLEADGGIALGAATTLSSFTGGGYVWFDLCKAVKALGKLGSCYIEAGGAVAGGTVVSSTQASPIQLVPSIKFRWGAQ